MVTVQQTAAKTQTTPLPLRPAVDEIKARVPILEVVSKQVKLKQVGRDKHVGLCPFHPEKTPSFYVYPATQTYYCFGCQAWGDAVRFVQETEGLSFTRTLETLRERYLIGFHAVHRPERQRINADDELAAESFQFGIIWRAEEYLALLKENLPGDPEDPQAILIGDTTRRLERLRTMKTPEVLRLMQRLRRTCSHLVDRCISEALELQSMLAPVIARIPPPPDGR